MNNCQILTDELEAVTRAHASPLAEVPSAGWGAGYSRLLWAFRQEFRGNITIELPKIHEKLGQFSQLLTVGATTLEQSDKNNERSLGANRTQ